MYLPFARRHRIERKESITQVLDVLNCWQINKFELAGIDRADRVNNVVKLLPDKKPARLLSFPSVISPRGTGDLFSASDLVIAHPTLYSGFGSPQNVTVGLHVSDAGDVSRSSEPVYENNLPPNRLGEAALFSVSLKLAHMQDLLKLRNDLNDTGTRIHLIPVLGLTHDITDRALRKEFDELNNRETGGTDQRVEVAKSALLQRMIQEGDFVVGQGSTPYSLRRVYVLTILLLLC